MPSTNTGQTLSTPTAEGPLLPWLLDVLKPMSRTRVKELLHSRRVTVNGTTTTQFNHPIKPGDRIAIQSAKREPDPDFSLPIVYEDNSLLVLNKPAGLLAVATDSEKADTAFARLKALLTSRNSGRPFVVHRLDRETSGLLLFARTAQIRDRFQENWEEVEKIYLAVLEGTPRPAEGVVRNFLLEGQDLRVRTVRAGGAAREAASHYRTLAAEGGRSLVEIRLETGRKHQIRVHMAGLGCPVVGDRVYGAKTNPAGRLGLHAWRLAFKHPLTHQFLRFEAALPVELQRLGRGWKRLLQPPDSA